MNRHEKETVIQSLRTDFQKSQAMFLVGVHGLTVSQLYELRKKLRAHRGTLRLAKNTLIRLATQDLEEMHALEPYLKNQVAVVFATNESPAVARIIWDASQANNKIAVIAGCFESRVIDAAMIKFLALLPPKPVIAAQLCATIQAPVTQTVRVLHMAVVRLLWVLQKAAEK